LLLALAIVGAICIPLYQAIVAPTEQGFELTGARIARMLLGPEQIACYACFVWACFILLARYTELRRQRRALTLDLLPTEEGVRILPEDARAMQRRVDQLSERGGPYLLSNMIRLALAKFAVSRSPRDTSETVRTQADLDMSRLSTSMATVNYLAWALPAIGFVGTVRGIGQALSVVPNADETAVSEFLGHMSGSLAITFNATLVALLLSLILMFILHTLQREEETLVLDNQQYCLEHLVNRLYDLEKPAEPHGETPVADYGAEKAWPV
jgi:biopolymer transport protein ExbB/TolQ